jgi:hypothetical protein
VHAVVMRPLRFHLSIFATPLGNHASRFSCAEQ